MRPYQAIPLFVTHLYSTLRDTKYSQTTNTPYLGQGTNQHNDSMKHAKTGPKFHVPHSVHQSFPIQRGHRKCESEGITNALAFGNSGVRGWGPPYLRLQPASRRRKRRLRSSSLLSRPSTTRAFPVSASARNIRYRPNSPCLWLSKYSSLLGDFCGIET